MDIEQDILYVRRKYFISPHKEDHEIPDDVQACEYLVNDVLPAPNQEIAKKHRLWVSGNIALVHYLLISLLFLIPVYIIILATLALDDVYVRYGASLPFRFGYLTMYSLPVVILFIYAWISCRKKCTQPFETIYRKFLPSSVIYAVLLYFITLLSEVAGMYVEPLFLCYIICYMQPLVVISILSFIVSKKSKSYHINHHK